MEAYRTSPADATEYSRPDRPEWTAAKSVGDAGEQLVAATLRSIGLLVKQSQGLAANDLSVSGEIEVKTDRRAVTTGNFAAEIMYRGRPSGIATSTASAWAIVIGDEILLVPTAKLRELVNAERRMNRRVPAGEGAVCILVPLDDLRRISRRIERAA